MSMDSFGTLLQVMTFGESHGPAIGAVLSGVPAGIPLSAEDIQRDLDRRRPGQSQWTTPRQEADRVEILSGVWNGVTTGTALALLIRNADSHSSDYAELAELFRPGHADYTYWKKYGIRDYRGGGRASGRETAARVAAGAVARKVLQTFGVEIRAFTVQIGKVKGETVDWNFVEQNPLRAADNNALEAMQSEIENARKEQDSVGGIIECHVFGVPSGWGEPVFDKLDALLAHAVLSVGAVKGIEFGDGFACASMRGSEHNDAMQAGRFLSNHAGGVLGGISNGNTVVFRAAVKPTPSIALEQQTMNMHGQSCKCQVHGRHDPCLCPRMVPVVEAMTALVLADLALMQRAKTDFMK